MAMQPRICCVCGIEFPGGPRASYCPTCRMDRQRQTNAAYKQRKAAGRVRHLGSTDRCDRCGQRYEVAGGLQRFCETCRPIHLAEHDRIRGLAYYRRFRDRVNQRRYARRRKPARPCGICGRLFAPLYGRLTCSEACRIAWINTRWRIDYHRRAWPSRPQRRPPKPPEASPDEFPLNWITLAEAAARWRRSPDTLRQRILRGTLAARKVGDLWLIRAQEMERAYGPRPSPEDPTE